MSVYAYVVTRNEADRYLVPFMDLLTESVDGIAVYDDRSTDHTVDILNNYPCAVAVRPKSGVSFMEHEGKFRQDAWDFASDALHMTEDDLVVAIDADEFMLHPDGLAAVKENFERLNYESRGFTGCVIQKYECWGFNAQGKPMIRTDGFWGSILGTRIVRWAPDGKFRDKAMGCGSEPTYVTRKVRHGASGLYLLHYGYVTEHDRIQKHERYSALIDHGHSNTHIQSIVAPAQLKEFDLPYVAVDFPDVLR